MTFLCGTQKICRERVTIFIFILINYRFKFRICIESLKMQYQILISASLLHVSSLLRGVWAVPVQLSERIRFFWHRWCRILGQVELCDPRKDVNRYCMCVVPPGCNYSSGNKLGLRYTYGEDIECSTKRRTEHPNQKIDQENQGSIFDVIKDFYL